MLSGKGEVEGKYEHKVQGQMEAVKRENKRLGKRPGVLSGNQGLGLSHRSAQRKSGEGEEPQLQAVRTRHRDPRAVNSPDKRFKISGFREIAGHSSVT